MSDRKGHRCKRTKKSRVNQKKSSQPHTKEGCVVDRMKLSEGESGRGEGGEGRAEGAFWGVGDGGGGGGRGGRGGDVGGGGYPGGGGRGEGKLGQGGRWTAKKEKKKPTSGVSEFRINLVDVQRGTA